MGIEQARALYAQSDTARDFGHVLCVTPFAVRLAKAEA